MNRFLLGYCITIISTMLWPSLPPFSLVLFFLLASALILRLSLFLSGVFFAIAWLSVFCHFLLSWEEPINVDSVKLEGEIIALVHSNGDWISLDIQLTGVNSSHLVAKKLRLTWSDPPHLQIGETWQLTIRPKSISSVLNQGSYNQQKNLLSKHIIVKGKVLSGHLLKEGGSLRMRFINKLKPVLAHFDNGDLMLALSAGDKQDISSHRWQQLRQTGTGHLMAISGLHLSVVGMWVFVAMFWALRQLIPPYGRSHLLVAAILSAIAVVFYAYLAGFSISTQRALIMMLLVVGLSLVNRFSSPWERLLYALFFVLLLDPLSCLSAGFWLSFGALAVILLTIQSQVSKTVTDTTHTDVAPASPRVNVFGSVKAQCLLFWAIQWRLSLCLGVLQAIFFGGITLHSVWINLILVPWFSLVVIPLMMLTLLVWAGLQLFNIHSTAVFLGFDWSLWPVSQLLSLSDHFIGRWIVLPERVILASVLALLGGFLLYKVTNRLWQGALSLMLLPLVFQISVWLLPFKTNGWTVHTLDVGQGLAVVIEKSGHGLLYDTGAAYGAHFSYAERVILPFLATKGIRELDYLILSHGDNDHAGGAKVIVEHFPDTKIITDIEGYEGQHCRPQKWSWQGLTVNVLGPLLPLKGNNGSCVIKIQDNQHSVLLTGDIEKRTETNMLKQAEFLSSTVLIAPHHGSYSSSTIGFVKAVSPLLTIFPAGFNNRYGFPKFEVVSRYLNQGSQVVSTGQEGQVSVFFNRDEWWWATYRQDFAPFWYNRLFGFGEVSKAE